MHFNRDGQTVRVVSVRIDLQLRIEELDVAQFLGDFFQNLGTGLAVVGADVGFNTFIFTSYIMLLSTFEVLDGDRVDHADAGFHLIEAAVIDRADAVEHVAATGFTDAMLQFLSIASDGTMNAGVHLDCAVPAGDRGEATDAGVRTRQHCFTQFRTVERNVAHLDGAGQNFKDEVRLVHLVVDEGTEELLGLHQTGLHEGVEGFGVGHQRFDVADNAGIPVLGFAATQSSVLSCQFRHAGHEVRSVVLLVRDNRHVADCAHGRHGVEARLASCSCTQVGVDHAFGLVTEVGLAVLADADAGIAGDQQPDVLQRTLGGIGHRVVDEGAHHDEALNAAVVALQEDRKGHSVILVGKDELLGADHRPCLCVKNGVCGVITQECELCHELFSRWLKR